MEHPTDPSHRSAVVAATLAAAALIAQQVAGRATRDALFLSSFPVSALPLAMIGSAVASALAVLGFSSALSRRSPARVVPLALATGTVLLLTEWGLSLVQPSLAAIAVYLHIAIFGTTVISGFWSLVNERFDPYTARRVMGHIGLGASLGGVAGGLVAWGAAGLLPVPAMLALMAAFNIACLLALRRLGAVTPASTGGGRHEEVATGPLSGFRMLFAVPYLRDLALFVTIGAATEALLDYLLNAQAAAVFGRGQPLMSFFSLFHMGVSLLALVAQITLSRASLQRLGLAGTVALRPGLVLVSALVGFMEPRLWTALLARGTHGVINNSLFRSGYELLFTAVPQRRKRPTKAIIDVAFDRLGTVGGGIVALIIVSAAGGQGTRVLFALAGAAALAALAVSRRLHRGYVSALEESLRSGAVRLDVADVIDATTLMTLAHTGETFDREALLREVAALRGERPPEGASAAPGDPALLALRELRSGEPPAVRRALQRFDELPAVLIGHVIPLLARDDLFLDTLRALRRAAPRATGQLLDALLDQRLEPVVRRRIARVLRGSPTQPAVDGLLSALADPEFEVRRQCARTLERLTTRDAGLRVPPAVVFAAAVRELGAGPASWSQDAAMTETAPGDGLELRETPSERGLGHVFTLLTLALEREPMRIAAWAVRSEDPTLRGTALEYLHNVLPDPVRDALWPHLRIATTAARVGRSPQQLRDELLRASGTLSVSRGALRTRSPR
jgi:AAA family ATP:ADP antiporter